MRHDGINTHKVCPDSSASVTISNQLTLDSTMPIITYVARNLEPYRGFPNAMRAIETTLHAIPNAHAIILKVLLVMALQALWVVLS